MKKNKNIPRYVLTLILIIFIWLDHAWAIKLTLTLIFISVEMISSYIDKLNKELELL